MKKILTLSLAALMAFSAPANVVLAAPDTKVEALSVNVKAAKATAISTVEDLKAMESNPSGNYYLAKDIIPVINENAGRDIKAVVLFSGDTGFFSGAKNLRKQMEKLPGVNVSMMPGISSVQALAARTGESWEDEVIISTHGIEREIWMPKLRFHALHSKKIIFITFTSKEALYERGNFPH